MLPPSSVSAYSAQRGPGFDFAGDPPGAGLLSRMAGSVASVIRDLANISAPPPKTPPAGWYAGMVLDPADFSHQLCNLQASLQRACDKAEEPAKPTASTPHH